MRPFLPLLLALPLLFHSNIRAQTSVAAGDVSGTWTMQGSPYLIGGDITIPNDSSLVIEPGVTVEFQGHYELLVNGNLLAIGTETDSILFTISDTTGWSNESTIEGGWKHIRLFETPATNDSTILAYCRIEYGKAIGPNWPWNHGGGISIVGFDKVRISNCFIVNNMSGGEEGPSGGGVGVTSCDILLDGNTIAYNRSQSGGGIHLSHSNSTLRNNVVYGNSAAGNGGGIEILGDITRPAVVSLSGDTIAENQSGPAAGGINAVDLDSLSLTSVTLLRNSANWGGAVGTFNSALFVTDCIFKENQVDWLGAGIAADYCNLTIRGTEFAENVSKNTAGAMHNDHCSVLMINSTIRENTSGSDTLTGSAGGINVYATHLDIQDCNFSGNTTFGIGGALNADSSILNITGTMIVENTARFAGGGLNIFRSSAEVQGSSVSNNSVGNDTIFGLGGGINATSCTVRLEHCSLLADTATVGGGMNVFNSDLQLDSLTLQHNVARDYGAALFYGADTAAFGRAYEVSLVRSQIRENRATNLVAGVRIDELGEEPGIVETIIDHCAFTGNTADRVTALRIEGDGQVFDVSNTVITENASIVRIPGITVTGGARGTFSNCLIAGNTTGTPLAVTQDAVAHLINSTIAHNADSGGAAISMRVGAQVSLTNCIVWGNPNRSINLVTLDSLRVCKVWVNHSLIQGGRDSVGRSDTMSVIHWGVGNTDMDPLFQDPSSKDYRLLSGSPCIGAGIDSIEIDATWHRAPSLDLDGRPRPSPPGTRPDMGAYEDQVTVPVGVDQGNQPTEPRTYALHQNYPNPFNPMTEIRFEIPDVRFVRLVVYDLLGREVAVLVNEKKAPESYRVEFNAAGLASGVYLYKLTAGQFGQTKKMVLVR